MKKVLVANRGEIAIRIFRALTELGIGTVGVYAQEDEKSVHRFKADEAYLVGKGKKPIEAYLDIEGLIHIAKDAGADAIHPGYGFLSENLDFAKRCQEEGITFIGPTTEQLDIFGDKLKAKKAALEAGIPTIPGTEGAVQSMQEAVDFANQYGYPIIMKAALGGGGRGMRVAFNEEEAIEGFQRAQSEAIAAFGRGDIYVERYIQNPKHIEVQILGDTHGNLVHLYERDCSVQRRHQKVVEVAPCVTLTDEVREQLCQTAVKLMKHVEYVNAGTVEFLLEGDQFYFIEVNPRVQVEHTISEMVTGIDIVQSQILIAQGKHLHNEVGVPHQEDIHLIGAAIQCRITTEDPLNQFYPDTGKINTYRSPGGFGVRLDAGNGFQGTVVTPFFDSLLVKASVHAVDFSKAVQKMGRVLKEFRIRGVKTNIPFLANVVKHPAFISGAASTTFIDQTPELYIFSKGRDRGNKTLQYLGNVTVNGFPGIGRIEKPAFSTPRMPEKLILPEKELIRPKQLLDQKGPAAVADWVKDQNAVLLTDTTFRDAHQSLLATRMRTKDMLAVAEQMEQGIPELFSVEMWGGATFDVAYRFLNEDPWARLRKLRQKMPNTLFQMLFRGSNGVGYENYPDNVLEKFIAVAAENGIDVFRIFDSLNWIPQMEKSIQYVRDNNKIAEATICYTGDLNDPSQTKYTMDYYKKMAVELENIGAHMIAIKDMAGLLKPHAAYRLISELKSTVNIPIHLHMHDTSGNGVYTYGAAIRAGVDVVDVAQSALSGKTSQPSMGSLYYALENTDRAPEINIENVEIINRYFEDVRKFYSIFEESMPAASTEVYKHQMPGGQYTNLKQQAKGVGLADSWDELKEMYAVVNRMFGDIVKVTPSSKVVGDMALFMIQNNLSEQDIYEKGESLSFPQSVISFFKGELGKPEGGFPKRLQDIVLNGEAPIEGRPGDYREPLDFAALTSELAEQIGREPSVEEVLSYAMYPQVFKDYIFFQNTYGDITKFDTPSFFYGMRTGEQIEISIEKGKTLIIQLNQIGDPDSEGNRVLYFELNGQGRQVEINDKSITNTKAVRKKAEPSNRGHIGATMPGSILQILVSRGDKVEKGDPVVITESMKMETTIRSGIAGTVEHLYVAEGDQIESSDLLIEIETI
ncbi:pyruvate carboxylase [Marinilactibacillus piezotolerans]|uniref:pyruvate carboxylase n=1 Tax=Marinilactibacillus piezotolerans TaxID=258723 RepID=UPI0009B16CE1|nr:pyruvate carboxylase [Marinilactibacillus piezotolerans]